MRTEIRAAAGAAAVLAVLAAPAARADAIDGDWCTQNGARRLSIEGPAIVTPGGKQWTGIYTRHSFDYDAPAGEREAGKRVVMRLVNDYVVLFRPEGAAEAEPWVRCAKPTV